ncbi:exo-alpha-sialidase [Brachyspira pilosicoli]|nr:exo-alpha-sialidase [Brachyspira pilosicoli]
MKKIIYSLLIISFLTSISCKDITGLKDQLNNLGKPPEEIEIPDGVTDPDTGLINPDEGDNTGGSTGGGSTGGGSTGGGTTGPTYTVSSDFQSDSPMRRKILLQGVGNAYYRNPVIVVVNGHNIFAFSEKRYINSSAGQDAGVDGKTKVDIVYMVSANSGNTWSEHESYVNPNNAQTTDVANSHSGHVVFKYSDDKIVIVASAGAGLARTDENPDYKTPTSRVDYIVGTVNGTQITWGSWKEVTTTDDGSLLEKAKKTSALYLDHDYNGRNYSQIGTQSARGYISSGKLIMPIIFAHMGQNSDVYELMGRYVIMGTLNGDTITWQNYENPVAYPGYGSDFRGKVGMWKETQVISADVDNIKFLVSPSSLWRHYKLGIVTSLNSKPANTTITASEGSIGYYNLGTKWFGTWEYPIKDGWIQGDNNSYRSSGILMVTKYKDGVTYRDLTMYVVDDNINIRGKGFVVNSVGRSASVDMLADGTIVTYAEEGGDDYNYFNVFTRYSQAYIAKQTGN